MTDATPMGFAGLRDLPPPPLPDAAPPPEAKPAGGAPPGQPAAVQQVNRSARRLSPKQVAGLVIALFIVIVVGIRVLGDDGITEEQPPVGRGLRLERPQIRWCVSEDIRLEAARRAVPGDRKDQIQRFRDMVQDYNARCGNYRYRSGTLQSVRSEVEARRGQLEADGAARFR